MSRELCDRITGGLSLACHPSLTVQRIIAIPEIFQPILANPLQILNRHATWDVPAAGDVTRLAELSERKVLAEFCLHINTYFYHNLKNLKKQMARWHDGTFTASGRQSCGRSKDLWSYPCHHSLSLSDGRSADDASYCARRHRSTVQSIASRPRW